MYSLDVVDLFPSVPMEEAIDIAIDLYTNDPEPLSTIPPDILKDLCKRATINVFTDGENMYEQTNGASMGGCVSPCLIQLFMDNFVSKFYSSAYSKYILFLINIKFYCQYK